MTSPALSLLFAMVFGVAPSHTHSLATLLDLPPRYMWGWSPPSVPWAVGYCGSVSLQTAGIYYGNWFTTDYVRGTSGGHDANHSLLLGTGLGNRSVQHACGRLKLKCTNWDVDAHPSPQHKAFLKWSRSALDVGWPVIFGVYWSIKGNDPDYDHIVPMVGYDDTAIYMNDLAKNKTLRYEESEFIRSRKACEKNIRAPEWCLPESTDYGVRVEGNADADRVLMPIRMAVSSWTEPDYSSEDEVFANPTMLSAELTIMKLTPGSSYALLRYTNPEDVPDTRFLQSSFKEKTVFEAVGGTHKYSTTFMSNSTVLFRCVPTTEALLVHI